MTANELLEVELGIEVREYSHPSGAFSYRERYKNGEPEGVWEGWHESGARWVEGGVQGWEDGRGMGAVVRKWRANVERAVEGWGPGKPRVIR